jgi:DNA-binding response OmpR family regulator
VIAADPPDVAVLDLSAPEGMPQGLEFLRELAVRDTPIPALVLTAKDTLADRVEVARLGGRGFLEKPFLPTEILDAAARLLQSTRAVQARVLAVDDDPAGEAFPFCFSQRTPMRIRSIVSSQPALTILSPSRSSCRRS